MTTAIDRIGHTICERLWRGDRFRYRSSAILFLCGKANSSARKAVLDDLKKSNYKIKPFLADDVWSTLPRFIEHDALRLEVLLGKICDSVLLFPESPGSWAELGAFSVLEPIGSKTLAPTPRLYFDSDSFLNNGPYVWLRRISKFHEDIEQLWECDFEIADDVCSTLQPFFKQLDAIGRNWQESADFNGDERAMFLLFLYFLAIIGPTKLADVVKLLTIANKGQRITRKVLVFAKLAVAIGVAKHEDERYSIITPSEEALSIEIAGLGSWAAWRADYLSLTKAITK